MKSDKKMPAPWRDTSSGIYYANFRVPTDLAAAVGKSIIQKSLRTKERSVAERKNCELWLEYQRQFDQLRQRKALNSELSEEFIPFLIEEWFHDVLRRDEYERINTTVPVGLHEEDENAGNWGGYTDLIDQLAEGYQSGKHPEFLVREAVWFLSDRNIEHDARTQAFTKFLDALSPVYARHLNALLARDQGQKVQTPPAPARSKLAIPLSRIVGAYLADRPKDKAAALKKSHACLPKLLEIVGDKAIQDLKQQDLRDFFQIESPRELRRLHYLREWSDEQDEKIFT